MELFLMPPQFLFLCNVETVSIETSIPACFAIDTSKALFSCFVFLCIWFQQTHVAHSRSSHFWTSLIVPKYIFHYNSLSARLSPPQAVSIALQSIHNQLPCFSTPIYNMLCPGKAFTKGICISYVHFSSHITHLFSGPTLFCTTSTV